MHNWPTESYCIFFGNDVPLKLAYTFCIACCACTGARARFMKDQTREWYCEWQCSKFKRHIAEYYNMVFKQLFYLNGSRLNQLEPVDDVSANPLPLGLNGVIRANMIRDWLELLRIIDFEP
jgi:hypothetical protein